MGSFRGRVSLVLAAAVCLIGVSLPAQQPAFRGAVDLIAVDVQVVDREGRPVNGIGADKFTVTIDNGKRRVVSADLISYRDSPLAKPAPSGNRGTAAPGPPAVAAMTPAPGRVMMLAVDCISFNVAVSRAVATAAKSFVERLPPQDKIGLFAFPLGPRLEPTTDRLEIIRALDQVVGQRDSPASNQFRLRPSELVDLSFAMGDSGRGVSALVVQLCGNDASCRTALANEVKSQSLYYEAQAHASLSLFRSLLQRLGDLPGRKTVVLASAGIIAADVPGARPDIREIGIELGRVASQSNVAIYTLFMDQSWLDENAAETRKARNTQTDLSRDSAVLGRWLDQFSGAAGGALIKIMFGNGEFAFDRVLNETSAYYLLGVAAASDDRDGRAHEINVKVDQPGVTVRGRAWVTIPTLAGVAVAPAPADRTMHSDAVSPVFVPKPRLPAGALGPLANAFERGEDAVVFTAAMESPDLPRLIRDYRAARPFWSEPRRDAIFALDLALGGLRGRDAASHEEAAKLLVEYNTLIRQSSAADAFECQWYVVQAAAFEGLWRPAQTLPLIAQARQRCPSEPRLALAHAILAEQQFPPGTTPNVPGQRIVAENPSREREIVPLYEAAIAFPATATEARVRAAWFFHRIGSSARARVLLDQISTPSTDPSVRYLTGIVRGEVLRAQDQFDGAAAAVRDAMAAYPGAQSARVAMMTLLLGHGDRQEAEALAIQVQTAPPDPFDPWWSYWLGDFPVLPELLERLRGMAG